MPGSLAVRTIDGKEGGTVNYDLGLTGLGMLVVVSGAFGGLVHLVGVGRPWGGIVSAAGWFVGGLVASEVVWGAMTVDEIQPMVDGLAFDESLFGGLLVGLPVALVAWLLTRRDTHQESSP
jgi:hypothetical protein